MALARKAVREAATRAIMKQQGFTTTATSLVDEAATGNPRIRGWLATADAVIAAVRKADKAEAGS